MITVLWGRIGALPRVASRAIQLEHRPPPDAIALLVTTQQC
jgi:hypothetical protein